MKFSVIIAARMGSSRLPGKALLPLNGAPMLCAQIRRLLPSRLAADFVLATTVLAEDDVLAETACAEGIAVFRGEVDDVLRRYCGAAHERNADYIVRVTGDCPFVDAESLDYCLQTCADDDSFDLASTRGTFPIGVDFEVVHSSTLRTLNECESLSEVDREHVTRYLYGRPEAFHVRYIQPPLEWHWRGRPFTVDTDDDYRFAQQIVAAFPDLTFSVSELVRTARAER